MNLLNSFSNFGRNFLSAVSAANKLWSQFGSDIDGEATEDQFGYSVSMNAAGDRMAIGAIYNDGTASNAGHVRVYSWSGADWMQLGADIDGEATEDQSGYSVSMNAAGDIMAIGAPFNASSRGQVRVYSWSGTAWTQMGVDIDINTAGSFSGSSVSMNAAGDRVAIGAPNDANGAISFVGKVRVYSWSGTAWTQMGVDIAGEAFNDQSGSSVSMNAAGDRVAIGAIFNASSRGQVRVYSWNGASWTQMGVDIDGEAAGDTSGRSVSMNEIGDRVAIGAHQNDGTGSNAGHVRVYSWNGTSWIKLGQDIDGEAANDFSGRSVQMNATGDRVAIGASSNANSKGHVRVYSWNGTSWIKLGQDIDGEADFDSSGWSVSMNAIGDKVAIGARNNSGTGHVRAYSLV